ncbi:MAG: hypothetical protein JRI44_01875 [Deltaproteobacteria bacterium]|nr:hypothetical protein [Deltaproteobacteria bacterium]
MKNVVSQNDEIIIIPPFSKKIEEINSFYTFSNISVSEPELFGLVIYKIMMIEKEIIASVQNGLLDSFFVDEITNHIHAHSLNVLADIIIKLINDTKLRTSVGDSNKRRKEEFSTEKYIMEFEELYFYLNDL